MYSTKEIKLQSLINHLLMGQLGSLETSELFKKILEAFIEYTEAEYGFIGQVLLKNENTKYLKTYALTNIAWNDETRNLYQQYSKIGFEFHNLKSLFGWVIVHEIPLITNTPSDDVRRAGLPPGHPPLDSFMGIPLFGKDEIVGMVGIANGNRGFNEKILNELEPLIELASSVVTSDKLKTREKELLEKIGQQTMALHESAIVAVTDQRGVIKEVNQKFCKISGYSREELIGRTHSILNSGYHPKEFFVNLWSTILSGNIWRGEIANKDKSGQIYWVDSTIVPYKDQSGNITDFISIRFDITDKKKADLELKKALELQRSVLESAMFAVIATDINGRIIYFNQEAERILKYKSSEVVGIFTPELFHDKDEVVKRAEILSQELGKVISPGFGVFIEKAKKGETEELEWTYIAKDRTRVPVQLSVKALKDEAHNVVGFIGFAIDISEKKALQNLLDQERALLLNSSKMATLGEMAAGIAHEINNPLAVINGKAAKAIDQIKKNNYDVEKIKSDLMKIEETSLRIAKIIKGLKTFSRGSESDPLVKENLTNIINDTFELISEKFKNNNIKIEILGDTDCNINCRPGQISQVLMNLIGNSFDAVEGKSSPWVKLYIEKKDSSVVIKVVDSGKGIPKEIVEKIMQPFFTTKVVGKGTGLGLSISKGLIEEHGGQFWYDYQAENTTFVIHLPLSGEQVLVPLTSIEAIQSHLVWRQKLIKYCSLPDGSLKEDIVSADCHCGLGKWIYQNMEKYKQIKDFQELVLKHREFHLCAGKIVKRVNSGERVISDVLLGAQSEYDVISSKVVEAIQRLGNLIEGKQKHHQ